MTSIRESDSMIFRLVQAVVTIILIIFQLARADHFFCADSDVDCLIDAINTANSNGDVNTINLANHGVYSLTIPASIVNGPTGLPSVTSEIEINGNGATIERSSAKNIPDFRIMHVSSPSGYMTLNHLTISNGKLTGLSAQGKNCAGIMLDPGSGLNLNKSTISNNYSIFLGGGICTSPDSVLTVSESKIINNEAVDGGGIFNGFHATLNVIDSVISDNTADFGGGVFNDNGSESHISGSAVTNNIANRWGGGIGVFNFGSSPDFGTKATIKGSEISNNYAADGGGIYNITAEVELDTNIISSNTSIFGGAAITNISGPLKVNNNCITENQIRGVFQNSAVTTIDAMYNWWGASDGPSGEGPGSGDSVSLNVMHMPFRNTPAPVCKDVVNNAITFVTDPSTYIFSQNNNGCPASYIGQFSFDTLLTNISPSELSELYVRIKKLTNGNLLISEDKTISVGEVSPITKNGDYSDGLLGPKEQVEVRFSICLKSVEPFRFFLDVHADTP